MSPCLDAVLRIFGDDGADRGIGSVSCSSSTIVNNGSVGDVGVFGGVSGWCSCLVTIGEEGRIVGVLGGVGVGKVCSSITYSGVKGGDIDSDGKVRVIFGTEDGEVAAEGSVVVSPHSRPSQMRIRLLRTNAKGLGCLYSTGSAHARWVLRSLGWFPTY